MGKQASSIFGLDLPDEATMQQRLMAQALAPITQAQNPYERIGAALGAFGGAALTGGFGAPDPSLQRAAKIRQIQSSVVQSGETDPTKLATLFADELAKDPELAPFSLQVRASIKPKEKTSPFAKIDPSKFTAESVQEFQQTKDYSVLQPREEKKDSPERVRETRINELVTRGYNRSFASDIVDGNIRYEVVPQTGNVRRIDRLTGQVSEVPIANLPAQEQGAILAGAEQAETTTLWDAAELGTGLTSALRAGASRVIGQIPGTPQAEKTEEARQLLSTATNDLARALVINDRFPVAEVERIIREAGTQPGAFDTPELMRSRLRVLNRFLKDRLKTAEEDAANPNLPQNTRSAQASNAAAIRSFLPRLGVPEQNIGKPPRGVTQRQWEAMTPEQRAKFK